MLQGLANITAGLQGKWYFALTSSYSKIFFPRRRDYLLLIFC
jgi:hypothetical protein